VNNLRTVDTCGVAYTGICFQVTALEQEMSGVLTLLRSTRNTFAPINRIPPDVFSLIPDYWEHRHAEQDIIALTHVCRGWREIFTSRSSLWTHLDCKNAEKTRVYIEHSGSLPLKISLTHSRYISRYNDALLLAVPHTNRLGSLTIHVPSDILPSLFDYFPFPAPLLEELEVLLKAGSTRPGSVIPSTIFPDHLSPLRKLSLAGVVTDLPWRNLSNLRVFEFRHFPEIVDPLFMTQLLDFFESAPLLRKITLRDSIPTSSTIPPGRMIPLVNLEELIIGDLPVHSTFLDHLSIPTGTSLRLYFLPSDGGPQIPICLANDFKNLYHIATINLVVSRNWTRMRLKGPSGELHTYASRYGWNTSSLFLSLGKFDLSKTQRLLVSAYCTAPRDEFTSSPIFQTLLPMKDLRTLTLTKIDNLSFISALNPQQNRSHTVLCPELEELVLYIRTQDWLHLDELKKMASERAKRSSKPLSITIVSLGEVFPREAILSLRNYVSHVEYKLEVESPRLDAAFLGGDDSESEWEDLYDYGGSDDSATD
jgi:hypothetical protein